MEPFLVSLSTVSVAEMGDRTQMLSLMLAARYRKPWTILAGVLCATVANHVLAGLLGVRVGHLLTPRLLDGTVGISMLGMGIWALIPDSQEEGDAAGACRTSCFLATLVAFFLGEMGDRTQLVTVSLAAAYGQVTAVVAGTTVGMVLANAPAVFLGKSFAERLPMRRIRQLASALFMILGAVFIARAL